MLWDKLIFRVLSAFKGSGPTPGTASARLLPKRLVHRGSAAWLSTVLPLTQESEGCVLIAYPDPASGAAPWTCGWGTTGNDVTPETVWTQAYADSRLLEKLIASGHDVDRLVKVVLTVAQKAALVDFTFNLGATNLASSTLLKKLNASDYVGAANEFKRWNEAAKIVLPGLTIRRGRERDLFLTGRWR
jgi:lysozyme